MLLIVAGLGLVSCAFILGVDDALRRLQLLVVAGWILGFVGFAWYAVRKNKAYREYLKLHPSA